MSVDSGTFRSAMGSFATGVTVITGIDLGARPFGMTVSAFSSLSLEPPMVLFCPAKDTRRGGLFTDTKSFTVNILATNQDEVSNHFAVTDGRNFDGIATSLGGNGIPSLTGAVCIIECERRDVFSAGDHDIVTGLVTHVTLNDDVDPLLYFRGAYGDFGAKG